MCNKIVLVIGLVMFLSVNYVKADEAEISNNVNLRRSNILGLSANYTLQYKNENWAIPALHYQFGGGTGGVNLGFGIGYSNPHWSSAEIWPAGWGIRLELMRSWEDQVYGTYHWWTGRNWIGVEVTVAFFGGLDLGYYVTIDDRRPKDMFAIGFGLWF